MIEFDFPQDEMDDLRNKGHGLYAAKKILKKRKLLQELSSARLDNDTDRLFDIVATIVDEMWKEQ